MLVNAIDWDIGRYSVDTSAKYRPCIDQVLTNTWPISMEF